MMCLKFGAKLECVLEEGGSQEPFFLAWSHLPFQEWFTLMGAILKNAIKRSILKIERPRMENQPRR